MTVFSTSTSSLSSTSTGTLTIKVSDKPGGGAPENLDVDVLVSVENSGYVFTGGNPVNTSTFGTNGARWSKFKVPAGTTGTIQYWFTTSASPGSSYVVMVIDNKSDGAFDVHWGTIPPGASTTMSVLAGTEKSPFHEWIDWDLIRRKLGLA